jgi:DnaJ family protein C protein 28
MPNIEELMRQAMAKGKFDDLPGKGKPLRLDEINPHADPEWELAYRMLKEAGYSLPWIEALREIETDLEAAGNELRLAYERYTAAMAGEPNKVSRADWERSQSAFKEKLDAINQRIRVVNLQVPNSRFQRPVVNFEEELKRITGGRKTT